MRTAPRVSDFGVTALDVAVLFAVLVGLSVVKDALASLRRLGRGGGRRREVIGQDEPRMGTAMAETV